MRDKMRDSADTAICVGICGVVSDEAILSAAVLRTFVVPGIAVVPGCVFGSAVSRSIVFRVAVFGSAIAGNGPGRIFTDIVAGIPLTIVVGAFLKACTRIRRAALASMAATPPRAASTGITIGSGIGNSIMDTASMVIMAATRKVGLVEGHIFFCVLSLQRGTTTLDKAACIASSGRKCSNSASGCNTILCASTGNASAATSSGVTYDLPTIAAIAREAASR